MTRSSPVEDMLLRTKYLYLQEIQNEEAQLHTGRGRKATG